MESFNLGAVLFALLLLMWICYAVPRIAERRDVMGASRAAERMNASPIARPLALRSASPRHDHEVSFAMNHNRLLKRPADPTRRTRVDQTPVLRVDHAAEVARTRSVKKTVLLALAGISALTVLLAVLGPLPLWLPLLPMALLAAYIVGLRRAELARREQARRRPVAPHARQVHSAPETPALTAPEAPADLGDRATRAPATLDPQDTEVIPTSVPRTWTPRPVPRPAYSLRGEVEDLASRHVAHRASVLGSTAMPLETDEADRADEADVETPAADLDLDAVLARRRA
ncbi:MAG: hypothetical protein Q4G40_09300 [Brachybacterium sp.]|nr:hypothetical protein [Brachybacterium sp.]